MKMINFGPMGYAYDEQRISTLLYQIILRHIPEKAAAWLADRQKAWLQQGTLQSFNLAFSAAPRFTGRDTVQLTEEETAALLPLRTENYGIDRLFRVWWLLQLPVGDKAAYLQAVENLFHAAEMNELVALYGALPLLAYPEDWRLRTAEGIRSNVGLVLEAIMEHNPYPAQQLDEAAWNQLVLKAFFTEKNIHHIIGLDERANPTLARTLIDLAHERWAAGRTVHPLLWRLVAPFISESNFADIQRIWQSETNAEREAAALACFSSSYAPAKALLDTRPDVKAAIEGGQLTWATVARRIND